MILVKELFFSGRLILFDNFVRDNQPQEDLMEEIWNRFGAEENDIFKLVL